MRNIDKNRVTWITILVLFLCYFTYLVFSKKFLLFVHPRMGKFLLLSILLFVLMIIRECRSFKGSTHKRGFKRGYLIFILPLLAGVLVSPKNISADISANRNIAIPSINSKSAYKLNKKSNKAVAANDLKTTIDGEKVNITPDNMSSIIDDMYTHPAKYQNKKIELLGYVLKEKSFKPTELVVARLLMTCCTADTTVIGLMADYSRAMAFNPNAWVKVYGIIKMRKAINHEVYKSDFMPYIKVEDIKRVKAPLNEYVY